jgi:5-methylthioadenosine/S-adenosylhomocysteine deaminase
MRDLVLHNCDVLQLQDGQPVLLTGQNITVRGNLIHKIEPAADSPAMTSNEVLDASGLLAIPGLINTHAHVPMVLFRGLAEDVSINAWFNDYIWPLEANLTPEDVYWGALLGMAEMIEAGVTSVADHYFEMDQVGKAVLTSGMRANLSWAVFGHQGADGLEKTCDFVSRWNGAGEGRITAWLAPHAPYTTGPDFLRLSARRAAEMETGIHIHVSETREQVELSLKEYSITPVRMLAECGLLEVPAILAHCLFPTDEDLELLQGKPAGVAHAPKTYLKLAMGTAPLQKYRQAGIPVGLATDGVVSSNTLDILEQMRLMALTQKDASGDSTVFAVPEVLDIAFEGGACVLKQEGRIGRLEAGCLADITLLRQDGMHTFPRYNPASNLVYSSRSADVDTVLCDGRVLLRRGQLQTIDKTEVKRQVGERLERLNQRVPGRRIASYPA